jgi:hypothetical protein
VWCPAPSCTKLGIDERPGRAASRQIAWRRTWNCDLLARKQPPHVGQGYTWASIVNAPSDLPNGEYQVMFDSHILRVTKERDQW